jgi:aminoglycoside phosphotransferase (APT) family kinase protein
MRHSGAVTVQQPPAADPAGALLRRRPPAAALRWAAAAVGAGSRVVRVRLLASSWLANHAVDVADAAGGVHRLVLRRWARPGWEVDDPTLTAAREAAVLEVLAATPVPAPRLVAADPDGAACDVPALLLTRLPGRPPDPAADPRRLVRGLAAALPAIHTAAAGAAAVPAYQRFYDPQTLVPPGWSARPWLWARAIEVAAGAAPPGERCLVHRDYHPGNTLWARGRLVGVVDWNFASRGSPSVDLGHMRVNLVTDLGLAWADEFLAAHRALTGFEHHPWWDLAAVVDVLPDWDPTPGPEADRLDALVADALGRLGLPDARA